MPLYVNLQKSICFKYICGIFILFGDCDARALLRIYCTATKNKNRPDNLIICLISYLFLC